MGAKANNYSKSFISQQRKSEAEAKAKFDLIDLRNYLSVKIQSCLDSSSHEATKHLNNELENIRNNYSISEQGYSLNLFKSKIAERFRNDDTVFRKLVKEVKGESDFQQERINLIVKGLISYIESMQSYSQKLGFVESFEGSVKESMLNECLFEHFKQIEDREIITPAKNKKPGKPNHTHSACFCDIVDKSELIPKKENESVENYCKRICDRFDLAYSDRIRQGFNSNNSKKKIQEVEKYILPELDITKKDKEVLTKYINKRLTELNKPRLYG